ncbi:MAG: hypothetical protein RL226_1205, partial [Bacteroidota bacterium]
EIDQFLRKKGVNCRSISSDLEQEEREEVMLAFRNRKIPILIATNVVSRGIDVDDIEMVINYDVPKDAEEYVHRIGRTARASRKGTAVTLVAPGEQMQFYRIEQLIGQTVEKPAIPESFGPAPEYAPRVGKSGGGKNRNFRKGGQGNRPNNFRNKGNGKKKGDQNRGGMGQSAQ